MNPVVNFFQTYFDILRLNTARFEELKTATSGFQRMLLIVLFATLIGGLASCGGAFQGRTTDQEAKQILDQLEQSWEANPSMDREARQMARAITEGVIRIIQRIETEAAPPITLTGANILNAFGLWLGSPFVWLANWIFYALAVLITARAMGGSGSLAEHMRLTMASAAPAFLSLLAGIPFCGLLFAFAGWVWGTVIFIKGVAVAHTFDLGKAVGAWIIPSVILAVLWGCAFLTGFVGLFGLIASSS